jgi:hypothetical protein
MIKAPHILLVTGNPRKLRENLVDILDATAISAIEQEILNNIAQLYSLGRNHYLFALRQNNRAWRHKMSRFYYAAYNASRSIRLSVSGEYSTDSSDHKKIEVLPRDFPNSNTYGNKLGILREDRNLCDYDHTATLGDLILTPYDAGELVRQFLEDVQTYLRARGVAL